MTDKLREALADMYDVTRLLTNVADPRNEDRVLGALEAARAALAAAPAGEYARGLAAAARAVAGMRADNISPTWKEAIGLAESP